MNKIMAALVASFWKNVKSSIRKLTKAVKPQLTKRPSLSSRVPSVRRKRQIAKTLNIILAGPLFSAACCAEVSTCIDPKLTKAIGVVQPMVKSLIAMQNGVISVSKYSAGQVVAARNPLIWQTSFDIENRLVDLHGRVSALELQAIALKRFGIVNTMSIGDYQERYGNLDEQAIRRIKRQDEIDILEEDMARHKESIQNLERLTFQANGSFPFPILLLSDPPRVGETITAGKKVVEYVALDRLSVLMNLANPLPMNPRSIYINVGGKCLRMDYVRSTLENKRNTVELQFQTSVKKELANELASIYRSPKPSVPIYYTSEQ